MTVARQITNDGHLFLFKLWLLEPFKKLDKPGIAPIPYRIYVTDTVKQQFGFSSIYLSLLTYSPTDVLFFKYLKKMADAQQQDITKSIDINMK